jgi:hypothetical protein
MEQQQQLNTVDGSPFTPEFNERLKSDAPLIDAVRWWNSVLGPNIDDDVPLSSAEAAAYGIGLHKGWDTYVIDLDRAAAVPWSVDKHLLDCWTTLENARAALRATAAAVAAGVQA